MDASDRTWLPLHTLLTAPPFRDLHVDCTAVGLSTLGDGAIRVDEILHLEGEIHEEPATLQSHCASLIAIWAAVRAPSVVDLGKCTCIGRRVLLGSPTLGRRFAIHAAALGAERLLFVVISSTNRWSDVERAKDLTARLVRVAQRLHGTVDAEVTRPPHAHRARNWYRFTAREGEILKLITAGLSNKQIARALGSSPNTVRNQIHALFRKTGVSNRTELALRVAATG